MWLLSELDGGHEFYHNVLLRTKAEVELHHHRAVMSTLSRLICLTWKKSRKTRVGRLWQHKPRTCRSQPSGGAATVTYYHLCLSACNLPSAGRKRSLPLVCPVNLSRLFPYLISKVTELSWWEALIFQVFLGVYEISYLLVINKRDNLKEIMVIFCWS